MPPIVLIKESCSFDQRLISTMTPQVMQLWRICLILLLFKLSVTSSNKLPNLHEKTNATITDDKGEISSLGTKSNETVSPVDIIHDDPDVEESNTKDLNVEETKVSGTRADRAFVHRATPIIYKSLLSNVRSRGPLRKEGSYLQDTPYSQLDTYPQSAPSPQGALYLQAAPSPQGAPYPQAAPSPQGAPYPQAAPSPQGAPYPQAAPSPQSAPYPQAAPSPQLAPYPQAAPSPQNAPYPQSAPYLTDFREVDTNQLERVLPPVASDIEIRRAVPFLNDFITRRYTSNFAFPSISKQSIHGHPNLVFVPKELSKVQNVDSFLSNKYQHENPVTPYSIFTNNLALQNQLLPSIKEPNFVFSQPINQVDTLRNTTLNIDQFLPNVYNRLEYLSQPPQSNQIPQFLPSIANDNFNRFEYLSQPPQSNQMPQFIPSLANDNFNRFEYLSQPPQSNQIPQFLPTLANDNFNRFEYLSQPPQSNQIPQFLPSIANDNFNRFEPQPFIPWLPQSNQQFTPVDRFIPGNAAFGPAPALSPTSGFNVEVSELGEPAFIVPEEAGRVGIIIPPPLAPVRTHGLSINQADLTRNEVRKDNGEFVSSYTTSDGTSRSDYGSLVPTKDGDQVLVVRGSYTFTTPEGLKYKVEYNADETGYHAKQIPLGAVTEV